MWTSTVYKLRSIDWGRQLASWQLSVVLMVLLALYYGHLLVFAANSAPERVQNIAALLPFWLLYALLLANTATCMWRRLRGLVRELTWLPNAEGDRPRWQTVAPSELETVRARLKRSGYRVRQQDDGSLWGSRRRLAPLATFLFHGSFFIIFFGFLLTYLSYDEYKVWVATGETYTGEPAQQLSRTPSRPLSLSVPSPRFTVDKIEPAFFGDQLLFTKLAARIHFDDGTATTTQINKPLWLGPATFMRLSGFGYAPRCVLRDAQGRQLDAAVVKMNVFPPGQHDYFRFDGAPHRIELEVLPDLVTEGGKPRTKSLNLVSPGVQVRVSRGKLVVAEKLLHLGERLSFEGLELSIEDIPYWGEFAMVVDPGAPVVFLGFLLAILGLLLKLRGARADVLWLPQDSSLRGFGAAQPIGM